VNNNLTEQLNFICLDKRKQDPKTGQIYIILENGTQILLPPNVHSVPALLLVKQNYNVVLGDDILARFQEKIKTQNNDATLGNGEPMGVAINSVISSGSVVSEQFTSYSATPEDLSTKGRSGNRPLYNYMSANSEGYSIHTPPDTYRPDKVSEGTTIDALQQLRNEEIGATTQKPAFIP
jgi:hypothetical protein